MKSEFIFGLFLGVFGYIFFMSFSSSSLVISNLNLKKTLDYQYQEIAFDTKYLVDRTLDPLEELIAVPGAKGYSAIYENSSESVIVEEPTTLEIKVGPIESFTGWLTGYGPDCEGCIGIVSCAPYPDVRNGNIYFEDDKYGTLRIVAADPSIPCGTVVAISNTRLSEEPILAIVLDRGYAVKGVHMDLLYNSSYEARVVGSEKNIEYDILRRGW